VLWQLRVIILMLVTFNILQFCNYRIQMYVLTNL